MFLIVKLILFIFKVLVAFALNFFDVDIFIWYPLTPFKTLSLIDILFDAFFFIFLILALLIVALTHFSSDITTVTINTKKAKAVVKKLKAGKKYFVKARTYVIVDGKKVYGKWSNVRKVK